MEICPNCRTPTALYAGACTSCDWRRSLVNGVPDYLTTKARETRLARDYSENYENLAQINLEESNIDRTFLKRQAKNLAAYIGKIDGLKVCEVGIGQGFLCDELLERGADRVVAVDVAISYLKRFCGRPKVEPILANAESLPFLNEFDLIVSTDVMEHVLNVGSYLYSINQALKRGGYVAIRVPYREPLLNYSPHLGYAHEFGHLRSFNKDILSLYANQAGFHIDRFHLDGFSPFMPRNWAMQWKAGRSAVALIQKIVSQRFSHWSDVIRLPRFFILPVLRPVEIVMVAHKVADIREN